MEATRRSDCLEILARELAELADNVRQGSLGPGASYQDLKTLYKQRRIDAATERLKTLFSVEYGREFAERTNRVLEQFKTAEFWALQALELHPFGNEHASNLLRELGETYYRETSMVFWKVEFEREDLLDRPELLAMHDALERYEKLVSSLIELRDYLLVVAGLVRSKMQPAKEVAKPSNAQGRETPPMSRADAARKIRPDLKANQFSALTNAANALIDKGELIVIRKLSDRKFVFDADSPAFRGVKFTADKA